MKIVSQIAEKILNHCSKCGGCPVAKIIDGQAETGGKMPQALTNSKHGKINGTQ